MATKATNARLHLLTARQVHAAKDGDHSDGGGLRAIHDYKGMPVTRRLFS